MLRRNDVTTKTVFARRYDEAILLPNNKTSLTTFHELEYINKNILKHDRLNAYRIMWILVFFDLPTETKKERKAASDFRKKIMGDGFTMFQFSIYLRHCPSMENADVHVKRVQKILPEHGHIGIMCITDKQFGMMKLFQGKKATAAISGPQQLEMF